jgi:putative exporter of polyketide antibiotics
MKERAMKILSLTRDKTRMIQWLILSVLAYILAAWFASMVQYGDSGLWPRIQTVLWKCGHLNLAAYLGFMLDRNAFRDRLYSTSPPILHIRRAIVISATMIAFGLAL